MLIHLIVAWLWAQPGADRVQQQMKAIDTALGVECVHCHVEDDWKNDAKPAFATARNMMKMVVAVNEELKDVGEVSCWTCHRGHEKPPRLPRPSLDGELARWPADLPDRRKLAMAVYDVTLGVACDHCHVADWKAPGKEPFRRVARMTALFDLFPKFMPEGTQTQCYMCHQGAKKPPRDRSPL